MGVFSQPRPWEKKPELLFHAIFSPGIYSILVRYRELFALCLVTLALTVDGRNTDWKTKVYDSFSWCRSTRVRLLLR